MPHDVFISYSQADKSIADEICAGLESRNIKCWIAPRDILPGMTWGASIVSAISISRVFVLIFSSKSNYSAHVQREVERAVSKGIPIIPFRIENIPLSEDLELYISVPQWLDALTPPMEMHVNRLRTSIEAHLLNKSEEIISDPELIGNNSDKIFNEILIDMKKSTGFGGGFSTSTTGIPIIFYRFPMDFPENRRKLTMAWENLEEKLGEKEAISVICKHITKKQSEDVSLTPGMGVEITGPALKEINEYLAPLLILNCAITTSIGSSEAKRIFLSALPHAVSFLDQSREVACSILEKTSFACDDALELCFRIAHSKKEYVPKCLIDLMIKLSDVDNRDDTLVRLVELSSGVPSHTYDNELGPAHYVPELAGEIFSRRHRKKAALILINALAKSKRDIEGNVYGSHPKNFLDTIEELVREEEITEYIERLLLMASDDTVCARLTENIFGLVFKKWKKETNPEYVRNLLEKTVFPDRAVFFIKKLDTWGVTLSFDQFMSILSRVGEKASGRHANYSNESAIWCESVLWLFKSASQLSGKKIRDQVFEFLFKDGQRFLLPALVRFRTAPIPEELVHEDFALRLFPYMTRSPQKFNNARRDANGIWYNIKEFADHAFISLIKSGIALGNEELVNVAIAALQDDELSTSITEKLLPLIHDALQKDNAEKTIISLLYNTNRIDKIAKIVKHIERVFTVPYEKELRTALYNALSQNTPRVCPNYRNIFTQSLLEILERICSFSGTQIDMEFVKALESTDKKVVIRILRELPGLGTKAHSLKTTTSYNAIQTFLTNNESDASFSTEAKSLLQTFKI